jgi:putative oxidoreductase
MNRLTKRDNTKEALSLLMRIWLGLIMIYNGRYIFTYSTDTFWHNFFKTDLHFPFPDLMFYLSKGSEFFGGLCLLFGFITRISAAFIACTMLVATLFANIKNIYGGYGSITFSYFLFCLLFVFDRTNVFSIDHLLLKRKNSHPHKNSTRPKFNIHIPTLFLFIRTWFGSLLIFNGIHSITSDKSTLFFNWSFGNSSTFTNVLLWTACFAEIIFGLFIVTGMFTRIVSIAVAICIAIAIFSSIAQKIDFAGYYISMASILFWFSCIFSIIKFPQANSVDRIQR